MGFPTVEGDSYTNPSTGVEYTKQDGRWVASGGGSGGGGGAPIDHEHEHTHEDFVRTDGAYDKFQNTNIIKLFKRNDSEGTDLLQLRASNQQMEQPSHTLIYCSDNQGNTVFRIRGTGQCMVNTNGYKPSHIYDAINLKYLTDNYYTKSNVYTTSQTTSKIDEKVGKVRTSSKSGGYMYAVSGRLYFSA